MGQALCCGASSFGAVTDGLQLVAIRVANIGTIYWDDNGGANPEILHPIRHAP